VSHHTLKRLLLSSSVGRFASRPLYSDKQQSAHAFEGKLPSPATLSAKVIVETFVSL
jgi:hypothetical protein